MNNRNTDSFIKKARVKSGIDVDKMKQAADNGMLDDYINQNLSNDVSKQLKDVLSDENKTKELLSSPQAQELMKKLGMK
ncbi:MAG: hypothetical protein ACI4V4_06570 [Eubacterium sp.]